MNGAREKRQSPLAAGFGAKLYNENPNASANGVAWQRSVAVVRSLPRPDIASTLQGTCFSGLLD